jgi:hypothetical protein
VGVGARSPDPARAADRRSPPPDAPETCVVDFLNRCTALIHEETVKLREGMPPVSDMGRPKSAGM